MPWFKDNMLAGTTPVHADMLMWHSDEPVESAAMPLIHLLFAVPQISVLLDHKVLNSI